MQFHMLKETPAGSEQFAATGEVITTNGTDAKLRCIDLSRDGSRYGFFFVDDSAKAAPPAAP